MSLTILGRHDRLAHLLPEGKELRITGFQSPAEDEAEGRLSLDALTGLGAAHIWVVAVTDDSLIGFGLYPGDHLVVDRSYAICIRKPEAIHQACASYSEWAWVTSTS